MDPSEITPAFLKLAFHSVKKGSVLEALERNTPGVTALVWCLATVEKMEEFRNKVDDFGKVYKDYDFSGLLAKLGVDDVNPLSVAGFTKCKETLPKWLYEHFCVARPFKRALPASDLEVKFKALQAALEPCDAKRIQELLQENDLSYESFFQLYSAIAKNFSLQEKEEFYKAINLTKQGASLVQNFLLDEPLLAAKGADETPAEST